jgi:uncharacterized membrane protein
MQNMSGGKTALGLDNNVGALVCYLNICIPIGLVYSIIVLVTDKTNKLPRFHAFQSILLLVVGLVVGVPLYVVMFVGGLFIDTMIGIPIVFGVTGLIMLVFGLTMLAFWVISAIKAYGGEIYKVPIVGGFADKFSG